jgi:tRNA(Ile)-lysidine synthase
VRTSLAAALHWFPDQVGNRSVVLGFSGGVDSTALLHLLGAPGGLLDEAGGPKLLAAHLDHMLRPDSGDQARFARTVATSLGIEIFSARRDVAARARREGRSVEEAGRLARLDFLAEVARENHANTVLLAHTLTDQAETVLLQLTRGAGTRGLGAMAPVRQDPRGLVIVRPLLSVSRAETIELAGEEGWPFYSDPSNECGAFTRNRIRREALPLLRESVNPRAESALARTASLLRDDEEWLHEITSERFREMASVEGCGGSRSVRFGVADLAVAQPALARRLVREGLRVARGDLRRIGAVHIEAVLRLIKARRGGSSLDLPAAVVRLERGVLTISRPGSTASGLTPATPTAGDARGADGLREPGQPREPGGNL